MSFRIFLKFGTTRVRVIAVQPTWRADSIKWRLAQLEGLDPGKVRLIHGDVSRMHDHLTLEAHGVEANGTIHVIVTEDEEKEWTEEFLMSSERRDRAKAYYRALPNKLDEVKSNPY